MEAGVTPTRSAYLSLLHKGIERRSGHQMRQVKPDHMAHVVVEMISARFVQQAHLFSVCRFEQTPRCPRAGAAVSCGSLANRRALVSIALDLQCPSRSAFMSLDTSRVLRDLAFGAVAAAVGRRRDRPRFRRQPSLDAQFPVQPMAAAWHADHVPPPVRQAELSLRDR
jgi:hypothetical protein